MGNMDNIFLDITNYIISKYNNHYYVSKELNNNKIEITNRYIIAYDVTIIKFYNHMTVSCNYNAEIESILSNNKTIIIDKYMKLKVISFMIKNNEDHTIIFKILDNVFKKIP